MRSAAATLVAIAVVACVALLLARSRPTATGVAPDADAASSATGRPATSIADPAASGDRAPSAAIASSEPPSDGVTLAMRLVGGRDGAAVAAPVVLVLADRWVQATTGPCASGAGTLCVRRPVPEDGLLSLFVAALDHEPLALELEGLVARTQRDLGTLRLEHRPWIRARAVDADARPIAGSRVLAALRSTVPDDLEAGRGALRALGPGGPWFWRAGGCAARAGADGTCAFPAPGVGALIVLAIDGELAPSALVDVVATDAPFELVLAAGGSVVAEIDRDARKALIEHRDAGALGAAFALLPDDLAQPTREADASTPAVFERLTPGWHEFRVRPAAHAGGVALSLGGEDDDGGWRRVLVRSGAREVLRFTADAVAQLDVHVSADSAPVASAALALSTPADAELHATTDAAGRHHFADLVAGRHVLSVSAPARALPSVLELELRHGPNEARVALGREGVAGRVVDARGAPLAGATVWAEHAAIAAAPAPAVELRLGDAGYVVQDAQRAGTPTTTDASGAFELVGLPRDAAIRVVARHAHGLETRTDELRLAADERRTGVRIALDDAGAIEVRVLDAEGRPTSGWIARLSRADGAETRSATPGADGVARFESLAPGPCAVDVETAEASEPPIPRLDPVVRARETERVDARPPR